VSNNLRGLLKDGGRVGQRVSSQMGVGHGLDSLFDDGLNDWGTCDHWDWGDMVDNGSGWNSLDLNWLDSWDDSSGGSCWDGVWVVVGVVIVWVVESVVSVVEWAVGVGVVVTIVEESLGISIGISNGFALGKPVGTESQGGAASGSDAVMRRVGAEGCNDSWGSSSSDNWGWGDSSDKGSGCVVEEGRSGNHFLGDNSGGGLHCGGCDDWGSGEGGQWGRCQREGVWVEDGGCWGKWQEGSGGSWGVQEELRFGICVTLVKMMIVASIWIVPMVAAVVAAVWVVVVGWIVG